MATQWPNRRRAPSTRFSRTFGTSATPLASASTSGKRGHTPFIYRSATRHAPPTINSKQKTKNEKRNHPDSRRSSRNRRRLNRRFRGYESGHNNHHSTLAIMSKTPAAYITKIPRGWYLLQVRNDEGHLVTIVSASNAQECFDKLKPGQLCSVHIDQPPL